MAQRPPTVYRLTAHYRSGQVDDTQAAIWPAWNFVHHGTALWTVAGSDDDVVTFVVVP